MPDIVFFLRNHPLRKQLNVALLASAALLLIINGRFIIGV